MVSPVRPKPGFVNQDWPHRAHQSWPHSGVSGGGRCEGRVESQPTHVSLLALRRWSGEQLSGSCPVFWRRSRPIRSVRPSYPPEAVAFVLPAGAVRVVDVGAGTGKLTALVGRGLEVIAEGTNREKGRSAEEDHLRRRHEPGGPPGRAGRRRPGTGRRRRGRQGRQGRQQDLHDTYHPRLAEVRKARGLTQVTLARMMHISQPSVAEMERKADMLLSTLRGLHRGHGRRVAPGGRFPRRTQRSHHRPGPVPVTAAGNRRFIGDPGLAGRRDTASRADISFS